jgi:hypothetical protein
MLDQWDLAHRKYEQIAPNTSVSMTASQAEQLVRWLKSDVQDLTSSVLEHPGFRRRVLWPLEKLTTASASNERVTVKAVESSIVRFAESLVEFARIEEIWHRLHCLGPHLEDIDANDTSNSPEGFHGAEFLSTRPWKDLVSIADYFGPVAQFNYREDDSRQWGEFIPFINAELRAPGDFLTRCMLVRIESWKDTLHKFWVRCDAAHQKAKLKFDSDLAKLDEAREELFKRVNVLTNVCTQGKECRLRDSCIALVQIYAAIQPDADLEWLGEASEYSHNASLFLHQITSQRQWDVPERIASALIDVGDLIHKPQDPQDVISQKATTHRLVLIEDSREGFFDSAPISGENETDWHVYEGAWELLWQLANRAQTRRHVDRFCLSNLKDPKSKKPPSLQAIRDRRSRLGKMLVPELDKLILDETNGSYRLNLEPDEICRLGYSVEEQLSELPPESPRLDPSAAVIISDFTNDDSSQSSQS